ncbi:MAG: hypothetical protein WA055_06070 [Candidatus Moraniibacteriota bacterium]
MKTKLKNKILSIAISLVYFFLPTKILAQWSLEDPAVKSLNLPESPIFGIISNVVFWFLGILEVVSFGAFAIAGIMYLTASGDETQAGKAKKAMTYSIIGIIVGLSGFVIFQAAVYLLNGAQIF